MKPTLRSLAIVTVAAALLSALFGAGDTHELTPASIPASQPHGDGTIRELDLPTWGSPAGKWRVGLFMPKKTFDVGEEVIVVVAVQNVTDRDIRTEMHYFDMDLEFEVEDVFLQEREKARSENRLEPTDFPFVIHMLDVREMGARTRYGGYHKYGAGLSSEAGWPRSLSRKVTIPPKHSIVRWIRLNAIWDVTLPTEYRVVAKAQSGEHDRAELWDVKSNPVSFSVKDVGFLHWARAAGHKD